MSLKILHNLKQILKKIPFAKKIFFLPKPFLQDYAYKSRLKNLKINKNKLVILATLPRSGTHYMQRLLANALVLNADNIARNEDYNFPVDIKKTSQMFPNNWHTSYFNYHNYPFNECKNLCFYTPDSLVKKFGFDDFTRSHSIHQDKLFKGSKIIHLRRNPLDYFVSLYFYKYKKRDRDTDKIKSPMDVFYKYRKYYISMLLSYDEAFRKSENKIYIQTYESLIENPGIVLHQILLFLGLDISIDLCDKAALFSSIDSVKKQENMGQVVNPTAYKLKGSFTNSGAIGQWKKFFNKNQIQEISEFFILNNYLLDNFQLEPTC